MTLSVPIPSFRIVRRSPKATALIRIVPEPKTFALSVMREEISKQPTSVWGQVNSRLRDLTTKMESVTRTKTPLELRLDPTL